MLSEHVDTLITIPNQKLLSLGDEDLTFVDAFRKADEVLYQAIKGISDLITQNGIVNVDFADVKTVMSNMGRALMGTGCAKGQGRARLAAEMAVSSPLLDDISRRGRDRRAHQHRRRPRHASMREIEEAATLVQEQAHEDANIIFGATHRRDDGRGHQGHGHRDRLRPARRRGARVASPRAVVRRASLGASSPLGASLTARLARGAPGPGAGRARQPSAAAPPPIAAGRSRGRRFPTRRAAPPQRRARAGAPAGRERATFVPPLDSEWDTPAFQRRGQ